MTPGDEVTIKELMNHLERILFTLKPENQLKAANALLARAETFLAARGGTGSACPRGHTRPGRLPVTRSWVPSNGGTES